MSRPLLDFLAASPPIACDGKSVTLNVSMRDIIMTLPSPHNMARNASLIPDIRGQFTLSTTPALPDRVKDFVTAKGREKFLNGDTLLGLSMGGHGLPIDIFLHMHKMLLDEPEGRMAEEIMWHETIHGLEGVVVTESGLIRETPWSYNLQEAMRKHDLDSGGGMPIDGLYPDEENREYVRYWRQGDAAQENVSEMHARVGVMTLRQIYETGNIPNSPAQLEDYLSPEALLADYNDDSKLRPFGTQDPFELFIALATYGPAAQRAFWDAAPEMVQRLGRLYGCDLKGLTP